MLFDVKCIQNPGLNLPQRNVRAHRQRGKPRDRDLLPNTNKQRYGESLDMSTTYAPPGC